MGNILSTAVAPAGPAQEHEETPNGNDYKIINHANADPDGDRRSTVSEQPHHRRPRGWTEHPTNKHQIGPILKRPLPERKDRSEDAEETPGPSSPKVDYVLKTRSILDRPLPERKDRPEDSTEEAPGPFYPNVNDVLKTRYLLQHEVTTGLPVEIVDLIIDMAEYWPSIEVKMHVPWHAKVVKIAKDMDMSVVRSVPLCYDEEVGYIYTYLYL